MKTSDDNVTEEDRAASGERHPQLSANFDERLRIARKQREKVLAQRGATGETTPRPLIGFDTSAWRTPDQNDFPQTDPAKPLQAPVAKPADVNNILESAQSVHLKERRSFEWPLRLIASVTLIGVLAGGVGTFIFLKGQLAETDVDIASIAAVAPDGPLLTTTQPRAMDASTGSGTSPHPAALVPDELLQTAITLKSQPAESPPVAPVIPANIPVVRADLPKAEVSLSVFAVTQPLSATREQMLLRLQNPSDGAPSVDLDGPAPTVDQAEVGLPSLEWIDRVNYESDLLPAAVKNDFPCQNCKTAAFTKQNQTVTLFVNDTLPMQTIDGMISRLSSLGLARVQSRQIPLSAARTNVRYFHDSDAAAAEAIAQSVNARLVNLSELRPLPPTGTIELRLGEDRFDRAKSNQFFQE